MRSREAWRRLEKRWRSGAGARSHDVLVGSRAREPHEDVIPGRRHTAEAKRRRAFRAGLAFALFVWGVPAVPAVPGELAAQAAQRSAARPLTEERPPGVGAPPILAALAAPAPSGNVLKDCAHCPELALVPAGEFVMGAAPGEEEREHLAEEFRHRSQPRRSVKVRSFLAGRFEVTRGEYRAFSEATGRSGGGCFVWAGSEFVLEPGRSWLGPGFAQDDAHPAACVSWEDASAYVAWLSQASGRRYRLLTEAEWEYAARGGTASTRYWGDDATLACSHGNGADLAAAKTVPYAADWPVAKCNDGHAYTARVGTYGANAFGLYDMLGNVGEWTQDCWNPDYRGAPVDGSAWVSGECAMRVVRGGGWNEGPLGLRAAYRVGSPTTIRLYSRGFRVARDL